MALPSLSLPSFPITIPSTGQEITYRPFLVKEEKILLMALEGKDQNEIKVAINKILEACINEEVDVSKLPTFDIEYLFLNLRAKSVGEIVTFKLGHSVGKCNHKTEVALNLTAVQLKGEIQKGTVMLDDNIGVKMHYPTMSTFDKLAGTSENLIEALADCIEYVFDNDEVYEDFTNKELVEWLGNLNKSQYSKINDFLNSSPKLSHDIEWICEQCGEKDSINLEGLYSFFTLR
jgi:hypothetical protein